MSKWHEFHSTYSTLVTNEPNTGGSVNLNQDWSREAAQHRMTINGKPLDVFAEQYNKFKTDSDVELFFEEQILKDMQVSDVEKVSMIDFLKKTFHQGGLMYPVSSALSESMKDSPNEYYANLSGNSENAKVSAISIVTTKKGFKVQEFAQINKLNVFSDDLINSPHTNKDEGNIMTAPPGKGYLIKAQSTINVDFSKNKEAPTISIESNTISYGESTLKNKMDKRSFGELIVDFFKKIVGLNQVKDISPKMDSKNEIEEIKPNNTPRM